MNAESVNKIESVGMGTQAVELLGSRNIRTQLESKFLQPSSLYKPAQVSNGYFESSVFLHPNLLYLLKKSPASIISFIFNKALLTIIKANPSLINILLSKIGAVYRFAYSTALIEELISNPRLLAALRSNSNLQAARRALSGYMPDSHYLLSTYLNKKHLAAVEQLFQKNILGEKTLDINNLIIRAWRTKLNADAARERILRVAKQLSATKQYENLKGEKARILQGYGVEDEMAAKILKYHYEQIIRSPTIPQVTAKALMSNLQGPQRVELFYDPNKFPNSNPAFLAFAGSGSAITVKGRKIGDEEEAYTDEHAYKEKIVENEDVHKIVEVILSKLLSTTY